MSQRNSSPGKYNLTEADLPIFKAKGMEIFKEQIAAYDDYVADGWKVHEPDGLHVVGLTIDELAACEEAMACERGVNDGMRPLADALRGHATHVIALAGLEEGQLVIHEFALKHDGKVRASKLEKLVSFCIDGDGRYISGIAE